jgi:hypothetical protein
MGFFAYINNTWVGSGDTSEDYTDGLWHHVCGVYDYSRVRIYFDGKLSNSAAATAAMTPSASMAIRIGNSTSTAFEWAGTVSDPIILSAPLSPGEVAALADPANVDLRVGGVPLILPPRRRCFPVASLPHAWTCDATGEIRVGDPAQITTGQYDLVIEAADRRGITTTGTLQITVS